MMTETKQVSCRCGFVLWIAFSWDEYGDWPVCYVVNPDGELVNVEHCPRCGLFLLEEFFDAGPLIMGVRAYRTGRGKAA